jgi:hypothetical protein
MAPKKTTGVTSIQNPRLDQTSEPLFRILLAEGDSGLPVYLKQADRRRWDTDGVRRTGLPTTIPSGPRLETHRVDA